jgi:hypothetical protein
MVGVDRIRFRGERPLPIKVGISISSETIDWVLFLTRAGGCDGLVFCADRLANFLGLAGCFGTFGTSSVWVCAGTSSSNNLPHGVYAN